MLDLAPVAARSLLRHGNWSPMDIEDATQEAALHIWQAMQRKPHATSGYYFRAGFTGAQQWMRQRCREWDSLRIVAGYATAGLEAERRGWHDGKPWSEPLSDARRDRLATILAVGRRKPETADRDALIVQMLSRGMTQKEIGDGLDMSRWHVGVLRQRIRKALQAHMEGHHE